MIKIISGFTGPGGSTVVFNTLVNLFNANGMDACLYGGHEWGGINCKFDQLYKLKLDDDDIVIYHFMRINKWLPVKRLILSCHETALYPINQLDLVYDKVQFVSKFQKSWQEVVDGVIIPNPVNDFKWKCKDGMSPVAGIIGSVDENKRTHISIKNALADGFTDIRLYGGITDRPYYDREVKKYVEDDPRVNYFGVACDMQYVYDEITHAYHSPMRETFNLIKPECLSAGVEYVGEEGNDPEPEFWSNEDIVEAWKKLLLI